MHNLACLSLLYIYQGFRYIIILYLLCSHNVHISIRYYYVSPENVGAADLVAISDITKAIR